MTELWLPQDGVNVEGIDATMLWYKPNKHTMGSLPVTVGDSSITVGKGIAQIDGSSFINDRDIVFDVVFSEGVLYAIVLVCNRSGMPTRIWRDYSYGVNGLYFPNDLYSYGDEDVIPNDTVRLALVMLPTGTGQEPLEGMYDETGHLVIYPIWALVNDSRLFKPMTTYYYPDGYNKVSVKFGGSFNGFIDLGLQEYSTVTLEGVLDKDTNVHNLALGIKTESDCDSAHITFAGVTHYLDCSTGYVFLQIPNPTTKTKCFYSFTIRKFVNHLLLSGKIIWDMGDEDDLVGEIYYTDERIIIDSLSFLVNPFDGVYGDTISDCRLQVR